MYIFSIFSELAQEHFFSSPFQTCTTVAGLGRCLPVVFRWCFGGVSLPLGGVLMFKQQSFLHASAGRTASFSERHADLPMKGCHFSGNKRSPDSSAE